MNRHWPTIFLTCVCFHYIAVGLKLPDYGSRAFIVSFVVLTYLYLLFHLHENN